MGKPITVHSCAYVHPDDIDPDAHASANDLEAAKDHAVARGIAALDNDAPGWSRFHRANIQTLIDAMTATHRTIRKVLVFGWQDPSSIDAMVLARGSLEHLYTLCLMFESSEWMDVYLKDGWKKQYERFLLQREETKNLPRYDDFSKQCGPRNLEITARSSASATRRNRLSSTCSSEHRYPNVSLMKRSSVSPARRE
jgi:hypothetical protein